jgi:hypothetical protein
MCCKMFFTSLPGKGQKEWIKGKISEVQYDKTGQNAQGLAYLSLHYLTY